MQFLKVLSTRLPRKIKEKQETFSQKVQLEVLWLQVGCAILYLDHRCTNYPKISNKSQNSIARNIT